MARRLREVRNKSWTVLQGSRRLENASYYSPGGVDDRTQCDGKGPLSAKQGQWQWPSNC